MKSEYTKAQRAAAWEYLTQKRRGQALVQQAEELLMDGEMLQRERILKEADRQSRYLDGMRRMAEVMGFPEAALLKAVRAAEKEKS